MSRYKENEQLLREYEKVVKDSKFRNMKSFNMFNDILKNEPLVLKHKSIIDIKARTFNKLTKHCKFPRKYKRDLPRDIYTKNIIISRNNKIEHKCLKIFVTDYDNNDEYKCAALTNSYVQCEKEVTYVIKNINRENEDYFYKKNVLLCQNHAKQLIKSSDEKSLKFGFYYDSDLYQDQLIEKN